MRLKIKRENLLEPLLLVIGAVEKRQTLPILSNVLLNAVCGKVSFITTDLEIELRTSIDCDGVEEEGEITLSARKLVDICRSLTNESILELYTEENRVVLTSNRSKFFLSTLSANKFPNLDESDTKINFTLHQGKLKYFIENTYFAIANQDIRYYLNGMLLDLNKDILKFVATDGHRLAMGTCSEIIKSSSGQRYQVIVPRKGVLELMRLLDNSSEEIKLSLGINHICIRASKFTFVSKLIDGKFPEYKRAIQKPAHKTVFVDRILLEKALSRVAILSNEKYRGVMLSITDNLMTIFTSNPEQEEAEEEVEISYQGADFKIGFNVNYLLNVCAVLESDNIKLMFTDPDCSVIMTEVEESEFVYVVMPMGL